MLHQWWCLQSLLRQQARKMLSRAYVREVKPLLRLSFLKSKQEFWLERYRIREVSRGERAELIALYKKKCKEIKAEQEQQAVVNDISKAVKTNEQ